MSAVKASTRFKKENGILQLVRDAVTWVPIEPPGAPPSIIIPLTSIANLQATPAKSAKVMVKIFTTEIEGIVERVFAFTAPGETARVEADAITAAIQATKTLSGPGTPAPVSAITTATVGSVKSSDPWSISKLEADTKLQQSLLKADPALSSTFADAVLSGAITTTQFWSTRTHLLRAHATERAQLRGPYNVLAAIKPTTVDNVARMSLSREQIHAIFSQHPLVKTVYDDNVPQVSEDQFWSRFFMSKLFKELKGEKILQSDATDNIFDRYLNHTEEENSRKRRRIDHVPFTIDLAGNEQDLSKKGGNKPDLTMRPSKVENVPIIRTLNSLSQKLVDLVAPADHDPNLDQDARYITEQRLTDLGGDPKEEQIILNIQDQRAFFSNDSADKSRNNYANLDPTSVLNFMKNEIGNTLFDIAVFLPRTHDDDNKDTSGKTTLINATAQITAAVRDRSSQILGSTTLNCTSGGLPLKIFDSVTSVHATSGEFLHHFWLAFLSGDEKRAKDINSMVNSLRNSKARIEAIASSAEQEKEVEKVLRKKALQEEYKRTGIKPKRKDMEVGGGKQVVEEMLGPTLVAIDNALNKFQLALDDAEKSL
ncbi:hypothetical protein EDC01DRAFT_649382 [Geopyxis carbonaria]|nr:hypothetical protein EDC01DRAFT_649382 [Geopyxis carbonaria]